MLLGISPELIFFEGSQNDNHQFVGSNLKKDIHFQDVTCPALTCDMHSEREARCRHVAPGRRRVRGGGPSFARPKR